MLMLKCCTACSIFSATESRLDITLKLYVYIVALGATPRANGSRTPAPAIVPVTWIPCPLFDDTGISLS